MKILCTSFVSKLFRSWCIRSFSEQFHIRHFSKAFYLHSKELVTFIRLSLSLPAFSDMCVRACVCYVPFGKVVWCFIFRLIFAIFVNLICSFLHHVATSSSIQQICSVYAMRCVVFQFYHQSWPTQFYVCVWVCVVVQCVEWRFKHFPHKFKRIMVLLLICPWVRVVFFLISFLSPLQF